MAAMRFSKSKSLGYYLKFSGNSMQIDARSLFSFVSSTNFHSKESGFTPRSVNDDFKLMGLKPPLADRYDRTICASTFSPKRSNLISPGNVPLFGGSNGLVSYRLYSSSISSQGDNSKGLATPGASGPGGTNTSDSVFGGGDWVDKVKDAWESAADAVKFTGEKAKEASTGLTPYAEQLLDTHPYLRDVIVPVGGTLTGTILAWFVMPRVLRRFHKYSTQGPAALLPGSSLWGPVPYEKSFWGALEDPLRYLVTFMAFSQIAVMVAPTTIASQYISQTWRGAVILSLVWFLHRWKTNVIARALTVNSTEGHVDRNRLLTIDKISSVGLFALGLMALAESCGVAVQSVLTVGGIGGVATAFASRDILGNVLSGLSVQVSQPFSVGDTIKAGSVEGQVVEMGLTNTKLLSPERFPVIVPNSLFSSQVIVNKSRAKWRAMVNKIPLQIGDFDKIPQIADDIRSMLASNSYVLLEKEMPYCSLSRIERSYAELTLGYNLKHMKKDLLFAVEQDILLQSVKIIQQHGATLGSTLEDTCSR